MLNNGTRTTRGDEVTISGRRTVRPTLPPGIYPFEMVTVSWHVANASRF